MFRKLLVVSPVLPDLTRSAASVRTVQLAQIARAALQLEECALSSASKLSPGPYSRQANRSIKLEQYEQELERSWKPFDDLWTCQFNRVDEFVRNVEEFSAGMDRGDGLVVIFDSFIAEEAFGWIVKEKFPKAFRILDTQDLHFLRFARMEIVQNQYRDGDLYVEKLVKRPAFEPGKISTDVETRMYRELLAIHRSDCVFVVSDFEKKLLENVFKVPSKKLKLASFYSDKVNENSMTFFSKRSHLVSIGNWDHPPNIDSVYMLKREIWPKLRTRLPPNTELHIWGSKFSQVAHSLSSKEEKFLVKGHYPGDVRTLLAKYRALLAPLRFGAGIKGKIYDSWASGTPVITTPIGLEGMMNEKDSSSNSAYSVPEFVKIAAEIYNTPSIWRLTSQSGSKRYNYLYGRAEETGKLLWNSVLDLKENASSPEISGANHFERAKLWSVFQYQKYKSKYINTKVELRELQKPSVSLPPDQI